METLQTVSLLQLLPPSISNDQNVRAAAKAIDAELRKATESIPNVAILPNLVRREIESDALLALLAWQFNVDFWSDELPLTARQELIVKAIDIKSRKGTPSAVEDVVRIVFNDAEVIEWYDYGGLPYRFRVGTQLPLYTDETIVNLIAAIFTVKNTRSWLDGIEIIRAAIHTVYVGMALSRTVTHTIGFDVTPDVTADPWFFAGFLAQRINITIDAEIPS